MHEVLKPAGFMRRRNAWRRDADGLVDIVNLQLSKSLDSVWMNLGVIEPEAYRYSWGKQLQATFDEASCTVRERLGVLIDGLDHSWPAGDPASAETIAVQLRSVGLPWLEGMHSLDAIQQELERVFDAHQQRGYPPEAIALAVVQAKNGQDDAACATLDARRRSPSGLWQDRLDAVADVLQCPTVPDPS
jgi:hypothetical protein